MVCCEPVECLSDDRAFSWLKEREKQREFHHRKMRRTMVRHIKSPCASHQGFVETVGNLNVKSLTSEANDSGNPDQPHAPQELTRTFAANPDLF